jgi:hypothetical protein
MADLDAVRRGIHEHVHGITAAMQGEAAGQPWLSLPQGYSLDSLPDLILALANEALAEDPEAHVQKVWTAVGHGQDRAETGFPETLLFNEYHLLRMAVWNFVRDSFPAGDAFHAIARIDAAITQATSASLLGYHRVALEKRGDWPGAVERLIANLTAM